MLIPWFRLSSFYFFFFAAFGVFAPFWPLYLQSAGFSASQIGYSIAVFSLSRLLGPALGGVLIRYGVNRLGFIRWGAFLAATSLLLLSVGDQFWWSLSVVFLLGLFWNAILPQYEALTLSHLGNHKRFYSRIRLWGSLGFMLMAVLLPAVIGQHLVWVPVLLGLLLGLMWLSCYFVSDIETNASHGKLSGDFIRVVRHPVVAALLLASLLQTMSHGAYYTFFSIYLSGHGYSAQFTGVLWAFGVLVEIVLFVFLPRLLLHCRIQVLFSLALLLTACRWWLMAGFVDNNAVLWLIQALHAASFALFHATAIQMIDDRFPGTLQSSGHALYAGLSYGLGGAIGSLLSGYSWEIFGSNVTWLMMAGLAVSGWLVSLYIVGSKDTHSHESG